MLHKTGCKRTSTPCPIQKCFIRVDLVQALRRNVKLKYLIALTLKLNLPNYKQKPPSPSLELVELVQSSSFCLSCRTWILAAVALETEDILLLLFVPIVALLGFGVDHGKKLLFLSNEFCLWFWEGEVSVMSSQSSSIPSTSSKECQFLLFRDKMACFKLSSMRMIHVAMLRV